MAQPSADHQAAQQAIADAFLEEFPHAWALLDVSRLAATLPHLIAAIAALVHRYGTASAAVAADYYETARRLAGVAGRFTPVPAAPPGHDEVEAGVKWATRDLWSAEPDTAAARTLAEGVADRAVLNSGRDTLTGAVTADRKARGWARVPEAGACAFCAMLATRGAVYKSRETAGAVAASARWADAQGELNRFHDHCRCHVEPVFTAYEPSAQVREWQALWDRSTHRLSGKAARSAFRAALGRN